MVVLKCVVKEDFCFSQNAISEQNEQIVFVSCEELVMIVQWKLVLSTSLVS